MNESLKHRLSRARQSISAIGDVPKTFEKLAADWRTFDEDHRQRPGAYRPADRDAYRRQLIEAIEGQRRHLHELHESAAVQLSELSDALALHVAVGEDARETALLRAEGRIRPLLDAGVPLVEAAKIAAEEHDVAALEAIRQLVPYAMKAQAGPSRIGSSELEESIYETSEIVEGFADRFRDAEERDVRAAAAELRRVGGTIDVGARWASATIRGSRSEAAGLAVELGFASGDVPTGPKERPTNGVTGDASEVLAGSGLPGIGTTTEG